MRYYLMQGKWSPEEILELLQSPPFRQQVDSFTYVRTKVPHLSYFTFIFKIYSINVFIYLLL